MISSIGFNPPPMIKYPCVGVACIVRQKGKTLLGKRIGSHSKSCWGFPGGHLEFGENIETCARRELLEETSLKSLSLHLGPWVENIMEDSQKHYITIFVFIDTFEGKPILLEPNKCKGWKWFNHNTLPQPLFSPILSLQEKEPDLFTKFFQ